MKKSLALMLALIMVLCMIPTTALAASNSTVVLHPSVNHTVTGVKVKVGDKIDGHSITKISRYDITVDLGKYNVNNDTFRLPYAKDIWEGVDNNKVDYISWAGGGSNKRSEGASALLVNGKNTAYYYFKGAPTYKTFTLKYDANGGTGAPEPQTQKVEIGKEATFTVNSKEPTRTNYDFKGWSTDKTATIASYHGGDSITINENTTLYAVWEANTQPETPPEPPKPENTPGIPGLTGAQVVEVKCITKNSGHAEKTYQLIEGGYTVGNVEADATGSYTCDITVKPEKYVEAYNSDPDINVEHKLDPESQPGKIKLEWDGSKWKVVGDVPVVFKVKCDKTVPGSVSAVTKTRLKEVPASVTLPENVTINKEETVIFTDNNLDATLLYAFTVTGTPGAEVTITDTGAKFYNNNGSWVENSITVTLPTESITDYVTYTVYGYRQFTKDNIVNGALTNTAAANVKGGDSVSGQATVTAEDKTGPAPSEKPNPSPSTEPTPTPGGGNSGGHWHPTTTPVPVIVIPPKTGDMTIWQSILHFLGIR